MSPTFPHGQCNNNSHNTARQFDTHGTASPPAYDPDDVVKNPPRATEVSLEMLLAAQTHLGHSTSRWNPQNSRYIFGVRDGIHIISLDQTAAYLRRAARVVEEVAARGGLVLFAGTRTGHKDAVVRAAELAGGYHVFERWVAGTLTNSYQILGHCERRVVNAFDEEIPQLKRTLEDRLPLQPDLVVCLNPGDNEALLHECALNTIPTIGVLDTDFDATRLTYQIPANDDSLRSTALIACVLGRAGEEGQRRRLAHARQGQFTYAPVKAEDLLTHPFTGEKL